MRNLVAGGAIAAALAVILGLYSRYVEPKRLDITRLDYARGSEALTFAFVTDMHIGPHTSAADMEPTIRELEQARPDYVLFGGDFLSESPRYLHELEAPLSRMAATATRGTYGIWGNHDLANIRERVQPVLEAAGVTMLTNECVQVADDLWLVGIDDVLLGKADIAKAFANVPAGARALCLWHEPDLAERVEPYHPALMLSGHTHGGQVRLPGVGPLATPKLGKRYVSGLFDVLGMPLYVSRGNGTYRPPVRFNCPPEMVFLRM